MFKILKRFVFLYSIPIFISLAIGIFLGINFANNAKVNFREIRLSEKYKYIDPLLECESNIANSQPTNNLKDSIQNYINTKINENKITTAAVYYRDLNNGPWFGINSNVLFSPASLIKVPMMIAFLRMAEDDNNVLNKKIIYVGKNDDYTNINFIPKLKLESGKEYSVEELIDHMILYSDTPAYNLLFGILGPEKLAKVYGDLGVDISKAGIDKSDNILSIQSYSSFFRILYNASYLNANMSEKALKLLSQSSFKDGLVAGIPGNIVVAHKFGERYYPGTGEKQLHDCGIVYKQHHPYMICVMTRGNDFANLAAVISHISSLAYSYVLQ